MVLFSDGSNDAKALLILLTVLSILLQFTYRTSASTESAFELGRAAKTPVVTLIPPKNKTSGRIVRQFQNREYSLSIRCENGFTCIATSLSSPRIGPSHVVT